MGLLFSFFWVRSLLESKLGIALLTALCLIVVAVPFMVKVPHLTSTGIVAALAGVWLVRRLINLRK